MMRKDLLMSRS